MFIYRTPGLSRYNTVSQTVVMRALLFFLIIISFEMLLRPNSHAAAVVYNYQLTVRPRVCVVLSNDSDCTMQLEVSWEASAAVDVCVRLAHSEAPLQCWEQKRVGEIALELQRDGDTVVQLLDATSNAVLSEADVTVVRRDLRDTRRRRRHAWSII